MSLLNPVYLPATATGWPSPSASGCGVQHQPAVARDSDARAEMENQQLEIDCSTASKVMSLPSYSADVLADAQIL